MTPRIATLTLNPSIDGSCATDVVRHTHKVRTHDERYDPGGGGINVARVLTRLGADVVALYLGGGVTGAVLDQLLDRDRVKRQPIVIHDDTRLALTVHEASSGREYRFVPEGPDIGVAEWQACLAAIETIACDWLVASGSLPRGVPEDFYVRVKAIARRRNIRFVLDSSGPALAHGLAGGGVALVKPSQGEFESLVGRRLSGATEIAAAAAELVARGDAEQVAVTLGHEGAVLVTAHETIILPALAVTVQSAVGAGDSFVAAMVFGLASRWPAAKAFRYGIAAGTAAVLNPGTGLAHRADIDRLFAQIS